MFSILVLGCFFYLSSFASTHCRSEGRLVQPVVSNLFYDELSLNSATSDKIIHTSNDDTPRDNTRLHRRQGGAQFVISDADSPPTLIYKCGVFTQICINIVERLQQQGADSGNGIYSTILHYAPQVQTRRRFNACGRFAEQCKQFYACDTRYSSSTFWRTSCDEFPFASSEEGGTGANLRCVSSYEQSLQGAVQGVVGQYAGEVINGQTNSWAAFASSDPTFSRPYTLVVMQLQSVGNQLAEFQVTQSGDPNSVLTVTRNANQPTPVAGSYNYDASTFKVSGRPVKCSCPTDVTTSCATCIPTRRPPFGPNPPDGTLGPLVVEQTRRALVKRTKITYPTPTRAPPYPATGRLAEQRNTNTFLRRYPIVKKVLDLEKLHYLAPNLVIKRQDNSCSLDDEPMEPQDEAEEDAMEAEEDAYEAEDAADKLSDDNAEKSKAEDAAQKAVEAASEAQNFINSFVGPSAVDSAVAAALAAAALLDRSVPGIDAIYSMITSAADSASSVVSVASAHPTDFPNTCTTDFCSPTTTNSDGSSPTYIPPPFSTTSTTTSSPIGTPGANGCFVDGESRTWGVRVPESRPSSSCYEDLYMQVEAIENSDRVRLSTTYNGQKGYLSWTPSNTSCGPVNFIQLLPPSYDTALTMEWAVSSCDADRSARIAPYWNNSPFPNFAVELLNLLPIGSPDSSVLQCYKEELSISTYTDQYYTMLASGASDPVPICSDKYPQSTAQAAAQAQARPTPTPTDALLAEGSAWPTRLLHPSR